MLSDVQSITKSRLICWTKMQAESGQALSDIIARKEIERRACDGVFVWGVGNAPSRSIRALANSGVQIEVVFSTMMSKPKYVDAAPPSLLVWRSYIDHRGSVQPLPSGSLVTSRYKKPGQRHYALICFSAEPLQSCKGGSFDEAAYRNVGAAGKRVASSQVTSLVVQVDEESPKGRYRRDIEALLSGSYWVELLDPVATSVDKLSDLQRAIDSQPPEPDEWIEALSELKDDGSPTSHGIGKLPLFAMTA